MMSLAALESENQRINRDGFRKSHAEDAEREHAPEGAGLRPTASAAFAPTRPIPMPDPSPAMPRVKLPVIPAAAASAARIGRIIIVSLVFVLGFLTVRRLARSRWEICQCSSSSS